MLVFVRRGPHARCDRPVRLGIQAGRHGQHVLRCGAESRAALDPSHSEPLLTAVRRLPIGIASQYHKAKTIHLVIDDLSSHTRKALTDSFGGKIGGWIWNRFTPHYTSKHGSWLKQAEIEIGLFSRQCLGHRRIPTLHDLKREAGAWNEIILNPAVDGLRWGLRAGVKF